LKMKLFTLDLSKMFLLLSFYPEILMVFFYIIEESRPHVRLSHKIETPTDFLSQCGWCSVT
jgi:hypothetical protein